MGMVPLQFLKELEHQARQNLSNINFTATIAKTAFACNTTMKCPHTLTATFKRVKSQIQKGANPEKGVAMNMPVTICDYPYSTESLSLPKQIHSPYSPEGAVYQGQHWPAKTTLLQPHLGDSRRQELRNSPFWPTPLFKSQLVRMEKNSSLKRHP